MDAKLPSDSGALPSALESRLLEALVDQNGVIIFSHIALGAANVAVLWNALDGQRLFAWFSALLAAVILRWVMASIYRGRGGAGLPPSRWRSMFAINSVLTGSAWGILAIYASASVEPRDMIVLLVTVAGLVAGAVATTSSSRSSFMAFSMSLLIPLGLFMLSRDGTGFRVLGGLMLFYLLAMWRSSRMIRRTIVMSISSELKLELAVANIKQLRGMLPICASCKKIRNDKGYWEQIEGYFREHTEVEFSHSVCPDCSQRLYPDHQSPAV